LSFPDGGSYEVRPEVKIKKACDGLEFGYGDISRKVIEGEAGIEVIQATDEAINDPELLVKVDDEEPGVLVEDDGCGDGRRVGRIFKGMIEKARSLHRPKVFGGGATMATSTLIATGQGAKTALRDVFHAGINLLKDRGVDYGAHTADHVKHPDTDSGCGAIDNAPAIVEAAVTYREQIHDVIELLGIDTEGLGGVEKDFAIIAAANRNEPYSGKSVMEEIVDDGKVVKELAGAHVETRIILNMVEGYTVNQELVRQKTGGKAEVFAVDVWRMKQLAEKMYDAPVEQHQAFLGELVYTLATAGVLTKGDLPVYTIQRAPQYALAA
jgi:hypothetical protein